MALTVTLTFDGRSPYLWSRDFSSDCDFVTPSVYGWALELIDETQNFALRAGLTKEELTRDFFVLRNKTRAVKVKRLRLKTTNNNNNTKADSESNEQFIGWRGGDTESHLLQCNRNVTIK